MSSMMGMHYAHTWTGGQVRKVRRVPSCTRAREQCMCVCMNFSCVSVDKVGHRPPLRLPWCMFSPNRFGRMQRRIPNIRPTHFARASGVVNFLLVCLDIASLVGSA